MLTYKCSMKGSEYMDTVKLNNTNEIAKAFDISDEAAYYAYSYYKKWLNITNNKNNYTDYELLLLDLFSFAT